MGLALLGSALEHTGHAADAKGPYQEALDLLTPVPLENLTAEVLMPYASALARSGYPVRAAGAIRQVTQRGYGQKAGPLAVVVADALAAEGRISDARALLGEIAEATLMSSAEDEWRLIDALERHHLSAQAVTRCLSLAARLTPSDPDYRTVYVRAVQLSDGDPTVARQSAIALAAVDTKAALDILDNIAGGSLDPTTTVLRAEILALAGQFLEAEEQLAAHDLPEDTDGLPRVRGLLAYLQGDFDAAFEHLLAAVEQDPDDQQSVLFLGGSAHRLPNLGPDKLLLAEQHARRTLRRWGPDGSTISVLALVQKAR